MTNLKKIQLRKDYFHFSAAHFTIFSATERERLHGHNFRIGANVTGSVDDNGLCFDYVVIKKRIREMCERFDEYTLIAQDSPYLEIVQEAENYLVTHNDITMHLLASDTILLPLRNITIEELSGYFLQDLVQDTVFLEKHRITEIEISASSGPNQWCSSVWKKPQ